MDFKVSYREKDGGIQCILNYKTGEEWKQKTKQGFKRQKDAKPWINKMLKDLDGINPSNTKYLDLTVKELVTVYENEFNQDLSYNTALVNKTLFNKLDSIANVKVVDIKPLHIKSVVRKFKNNAPATQKTNLAVLRRLFNFAIDDLEIINKNPCRKIKTPAIQKKEMFVITADEFYNEFLPLFTRADYVLLIKIAFSTGMRIGEIEGLTYDCINKDSITVNKQWKLIKKNIYGFGTLKTDNSYRDIPVPKALIKEIKEFRKTNHTNLTNRIFWKHNRTSSAAMYIKSKIRNTKFEDFSVHCFRHSYVSILIQKGIDFKTIADLIGDSVEMVMSTYSHMNSDSFEIVKNIIENHL